MNKELSPPFQTIIAQAEPESGSNRFIVGAFEPGITVYSQQVRALNLVYAIHQEGRVTPGDKIAIIGGGISGVTAATAAIVLGYEVHIFESKPTLCHLQDGCDTRWIHPHLYHWPAFGSERPYAELPVLNWRSGTAAYVVEQILGSFEQFRGEYLHIHCGASVYLPEPLRVEWQGSHGNPANGAERVKALIFTIGFGVERHVEKGAVSYWRNDSVNQSQPGALHANPTSYLVSGTGDGGLIDLLRVRIDKFNQDRILGELIDDKESELLSRLRELPDKWSRKERASNSTWLFDRYSDLYREHLLDSIVEKIRTRLRRDTTAILNGRPQTFPRALRLDSASIFNTLLAYCLFSQNAFTYKSGLCEVESPSSVTINGEKFNADRYIIRHGTDREALIRAADFTAAAKVISSPDPIRKELDTSIRLWPAGWWGENAKRVLPQERTEFVSPSLQIIATTFVSTLSDILKLLHKDTDNLQFRITLHRTISVSGEDFLQQISRYAGTRTSGTVGRVFSVDAGLIGLASRLGQPVCIRRSNDFDEVWEKLHFGALEARAIHASVRSLLACPFFASHPDGGTPEYVVLILFLDSAQEDFFKDDVLKTIYAACHGLVKNLEEMKENEDIVFPSSSYSGYKFTRPRVDLEFLANFKGSILAESKIFQNFVQDLTFRSINYIDTFLKR